MCGQKIPALHLRAQPHEAQGAQGAAEMWGIETSEAMF